MKRIEDQEKELLNQMKKSYGVSEKAQKSETRKRTHEENEELLTEESTKKKAKKSKKEKRGDEVTENGNAGFKDSRVESLQSEAVVDTELVKKKKKKDDKAPLEIVESSDVALPADAESNAIKKKKKKESSDRDVESNKEQPAPETTCENAEPPKKKKKKKKEKKD